MRSGLRLTVARLARRSEFASWCNCAWRSRLAVDPNDSLTRSLSLGTEVPPRIICPAWHRDRYRSPAARAFVEAARAVCVDLELEAQPQVAA